MQMKTKSKLLKFFIILIAVIFTIVFSIYCNFFTIWWIKGDEPIQSVASPDNRYTVTAYLNNGGATTAYAVLGKVKDNKTGLKRNIYWQYRCSEAEIEWIDEATVSINGIKLDVKKDTYDYRNQ